VQVADDGVRLILNALVHGQDEPRHRECLELIWHRFGRLLEPATGQAERDAVIDKAVVRWRGKECSLYRKLAREHGPDVLAMSCTRSTSLAPARLTSGRRHAALSPTVPAIKVLDISGNDVTEEGVEVVCELITTSQQQHLTALNMSGNPLGDVGVSILTSALKTESACAKLRALYLDNVAMTEVSRLLQSPFCDSCSCCPFRLGMTRVTCKGGLSTLLRTLSKSGSIASSLDTVSLNNNIFTSVALNWIVSSLKGFTLDRVTLEPLGANKKLCSPVKYEPDLHRIKAIRRQLSHPKSATSPRTMSAEELL
jgi:Leucine-rich repeat (LRR) protein